MLELKVTVTSGVLTFAWMVRKILIVLLKPLIVIIMSLYNTSQPPPTSSRPAVTGYKISHNVTGVITVNSTNETKFTIDHKDPGTYSFSVLAVNTLGDGEESTILTTGQCELNSINNISIFYNTNMKSLVN